MPATVTLTTAPIEHATGPVPYEYVEATAADYPQALQDATARVPEGRRAIVIRAERT